MFGQAFERTFLVVHTSPFSGPRIRKLHRRVLKSWIHNALGLGFIRLGCLHVRAVQEITTHAQGLCPLYYQSEQSVQMLPYARSTKPVMIAILVIIWGTALKRPPLPQILLVLEDGICAQKNCAILGIHPKLCVRNGHRSIITTSVCFLGLALRNLPASKTT